MTGRASLTRAAIYARVSTFVQDANLQVRELEQFAACRGWHVTEIYIDRGASGAKDSRPELNRMMADASRRR